MKALLSATLLICASCKCKPTESKVDAGTASTPRRGGTLTVRLPLEPTGLTRLHDRFAEGTMTRITVGPIYETLDALTTKTTESDDHLTLTLQLKPGVKFHDGTEFTSADVKATFEVILDEKLPTSALRSSLDTVASVAAPDAQTVIITFKKYYFLATHTVLSAVPIMPAKALSSGDFDTLPIHRAPIGTGPFKFEKWEPGVSLTYVRADDRAWLDKIVFRFVKDDAAALQALEKNEFDLYTRVSPAAFVSFANKPGYERINFPENAYAWIGFDQRKPLFADRDVRRALAMLYPDAAIDAAVDLGLEPRTTCPWMDGTPSCDATVKPIVFDLAAAKALLAKDGWKDSDGDGVLDREGVKFSFAFLIAAQSVKMNKLMPIYLDTLRQASIDARIETVDISAYMSRVRAHDFDAMALSWSSPDTVQDNFANFHSSQAASGNDFVGYSNATVDTLLERIRSEADPAARSALERQAHKLIFEDQAYLFLGRRPSLDLVKRNVHGLQPSLRGYDFAKVWVE
ncbi:MAG: ABC transporter substrate-binding protein [Archangium sp.]